jgi:hypothetical protein
MQKIFNVKLYLKNRLFLSELLLFIFIMNIYNKFKFIYNLYYKFIFSKRIYAYKQNLFKIQKLNLLYIFFSINKYFINFDLCILNLSRFFKFRIKKMSILKFKFKKELYFIFPNYYINFFLLFFYSYIRIYIVFGK